MTQYFDINVPGINEEKLPVTIAAPSEDAAQLFVASVLNGMYLDKPCTLEECAIQKRNTENLVPDIHLDERGLVAGSLIDIDTMESAKLMSVYSSVGNAMESLKKITSAIGELDDGSFLINIDDDEEATHNTMRFAYDSLSAALLHLSGRNLNAEIELLHHHPAIPALDGLVSLANQDKDGSVFLSEEAVDVVEDAKQIAGMNSQALLRESVNNLYNTMDLNNLIDKPYSDAKADIAYLDERNKIPVDTAIILSETLDLAIKASSHDDLLMTSSASSKELAP